MKGFSSPPVSCGAAVRGVEGQEVSARADREHAGLAYAWDVAWQRLGPS